MLPRKYCYQFPDITTKTTNRKQTLSQYFFSQNCILCNKLSQHGFCEQCQKNPQYLIVQLNHLLSKWTKKQNDLEMVKISTLNIKKNCLYKNVFTFRYVDLAVEETLN